MNQIEGKRIQFSFYIIHQGSNFSKEKKFLVTNGITYTVLCSERKKFLQPGSINNDKRPKLVP